MSRPSIDILTIGNALVDILAQADDRFLVAQGIAKGSMTLIDTARANALYNMMGPAIETSGGSAGNTAAACASFGLNTAYIAKIAEDPLGDIFTHDITAAHVTFKTPRLKNRLGTGRCMIFITPDGERSMNTYLGASNALSPDDIDEDLIGACAVTYMEGYLWDPPLAKKAFVKAATLAHRSKRLTALTLSDSFCVDRYRDEFLNLFRTSVINIMFANEAEVKSLYQTGDFHTACEGARQDAQLSLITRGAKGAIAVSKNETVSVPVYPVARIVDATGAGDAFAAGALAGLAKERPLETCLRLGCLAASEVIGHIGPRSQMNLKNLAEQNGIRL